jgi:hypothetical protein
MTSNNAIHVQVKEGGKNDNAKSINTLKVDEYLSQPYFGRVWRWHSHSRNGDLGVHRDSRNFKVWL